MTVAVATPIIAFSGSLGNKIKILTALRTMFNNRLVELTIAQKRTLSVLLAVERYICDKLMAR